MLRVKVLDKTHFKSNHYWIMVLLTKLTNLKSIKLHACKTQNVTTDFFKFFHKGMKYMTDEGRHFFKIQTVGLLNNGNSADFLYQCLKPNTKLISLDFSHQMLSNQDSKALGKILSEFNTIKEVNLSACGLNSTTVKEIADGLMRAKQLEVLNLSKNTSVGHYIS